MSLVGLEINQSVQDWTGSVPLVEGKPTVVRAFIQSLDSTPDRVVARLHAERNGQAIVGSPINPINTGGSALAYQDARLRRADLDASVNFEIPQSWASGDVTFRVEVVGSEALCRDCLLYTSPSPRDLSTSRMPSSA